MNSEKLILISKKYLRQPLSNLVMLKFCSMYVSTVKLGYKELFGHPNAKCSLSF